MKIAIIGNSPKVNIENLTLKLMEHGVEVVHITDENDQRLKGNEFDQFWFDECTPIQTKYLPFWRRRTGGFEI